MTSPKRDQQAASSDKPDSDATLTGTELTPRPGDGGREMTVDSPSPWVALDALDALDGAGQQPGLEEPPPRVTGMIDASAILRAEAAFRRAQTHFLQCRHPHGSDEYLYELGQYSIAQSRLIEAQDAILHRLGIL